MAVKFPLKFRGVDVRNIEDLRKNFELNAAIEYFKDGRLLKWLEARYYDDEAEKISELDENAPDFREKFCAALGVEFDDNSARLEEKIARLRELTDDKSIITNATTTALTQEDLADLLDAGVRTIYLCGKVFSIPIRVRDKNYIGILDAPTIKIRANSQADLDDKNIRFDNVILPWDISDAEEKIYTPTASAESSRMRELRDTFEVIFGTRDTWTIIEGRGKSGKVSTDELTLAEKKTLIQLICGGEYAEDDIIHLRALKDLSAGWAFTKDAFCIGGTLKDDAARDTLGIIAFQMFKQIKQNSISFPQLETGTVKYSDITGVNFSGKGSTFSLTINFDVNIPDSAKKTKYFIDNRSDFNRFNHFTFRWLTNYKKNFFGEDIVYRIGKFLEFAKG